MVKHITYIGVTLLLSAAIGIAFPALLFAQYGLFWALIFGGSLGTIGVLWFYGKQVTATMILTASMGFIGAMLITLPELVWKSPFFKQLLISAGLSAVMAFVPLAVLLYQNRADYTTKNPITKRMAVPSKTI